MQITRALWIVPALLPLLATPASAEEDPVKMRIRTGSSVLAHVDRERVDSSWLTGHLNRMHLHQQRGFAYTQAFDKGEKGLELNVHGPAVGSKRAFGLGIELRF
jgi:hypothetical protein